MGIRRLTVAQAVVEFLIAQKSERDGETQPFFAGVFGIFGHGNVAGLGEALLAARDRMRFVLPRNEQAMVHTAAAFAKMRNRLQTYACTTSIGPGATNMITAAAGATINRVPVLLLPGDIFATRRAAPVLQQLESPVSPDVSVNDCFRPISRFWDRINRPEQLGKAVDRIENDLRAQYLIGFTPTGKGAVKYRRISLKTAADFIAAGAMALGVGADLVSGSPAEIAEKARQYVAAVTAARWPGAHNPL